MQFRHLLDCTPEELIAVPDSISMVIGCDRRMEHGAYLTLGDPQLFPPIVRPAMPAVYSVQTEYI
jgi:hypothetical protein